jgi:Zn-dependent protease
VRGTVPARPDPLPSTERLGYTGKGPRRPGIALDITPEKAREALLLLAALIASISVHEFGHAWVATRLGDPLPAAQKRVTLWPLRHIDPIGTILFPLVMFYVGTAVSFGSHLPLLGWGRPVQTDRGAYTRRLSPATGHLLVSLAGPAMNLVLVAVVSLGLLVGGRAGLLSAVGFEAIFYRLVALNFLLMFLNLFPLPPLDGGAVLAWGLPRSLQSLVRWFERGGFLLVLGLSLLTPVFKYFLMPAGWASNAWESLLMRMAGL